MEPEEFDKIYGKTIDEALETGFLFGHSLNYYEDQHTREELIQRGHSEELIACADRVLAHFGTSVGAKLGLCPPELWTQRPCADCDVIVNDSFSARYGIYLCQECFEKREGMKKCSECDSLYDDHAIKDDFSGRCKRQYVAKDTWKYLCNWCAINSPLGSDDFKKNRGGRDLDFHNLKRLVDDFKLIVKDRKIYFPNDKEIEWYYENESVKGSEISGNKKSKEEYLISYTGFVVETFSKPTQINPNDRRYWRHWLIWHSKDACKLVQIVRVRVRCKNSLAYLEFIYKDAFHPTIDIRNTQKIKKFDDLKEVWAGVKLVRSIKQNRSGRPLRSGNFRSKQEFTLALVDVLKSIKAMPNFIELCLAEVYYRLGSHPLNKQFQKGKTISLEQARKRKRTLTRWLEQAELTWDDVKQIYDSLPSD
jgi:hypothetical protein